MEGTFRWYYLIPALFATLAGLFAYLSWNRGGEGDYRTSGAKKSFLRIAVVFGIVSLFLLIYL